MFPFLRKLQLVILVTVLSSTLANATTWYVDNTATGSKNGTSWANAWTSLSSISGVKGGDTVYISGGPSGSSQTYSVSSWAPAGGSSGNIITYQIGQDSLHNGTAIFSGSGTFLNPSSYTAIVGDAGDGKMHFQANGYVTIIWWNSGNLTKVRVGYVNFGQVGSNGANPEDVMFLDSVSAFEFDHNYIFMTSPTGNSWIYMITTDGTWDGTRIHDNTVQAYNYYRLGPDFIESGTSTGFSVYNNKFSAVNNSAFSNNGQHQDGWQDTGGSSYIKIYGNVMENLGNSCIFADGYYGGFTHLWIYNNVGYMSSTVINGWYPEGITIRPDGDSSTKAFSDVQVFNNLMADMQTEFAVAEGANIYGSGYSATFANCSIANNISINTGVGSPGGGIQYDSGISAADNVNLNIASDNGDFATYSEYSANNNFEITSSASSLISGGANESSYFTTDLNGDSRPSSGAWSIGPYILGSTVTTNPPTTNPPPAASLTVSPITQNASDVDPTTAGVQVYEGTVVTYSGTATETGTNTVSWKWTYTVNGGASVTYQSGTGTVPSVQFDYATGTGGNTYVWTLTASDGVNNASSSITTGVETPPVANTSLTFQATAGTITAPFTVTGNYISQSVQTTVISSAGEDAFNFTITNAGNYVIQALVNAPGDSANSFYVNIDAQPVDPTMCWDIFPLTTNFEQRIVSWRGTGTDTNNQYVPKIFNLATGAHQIIFAGREPGTELESFSILELPATPLDLHVLPTVSSNAPNFSAVAQ
jgi:hypothetical protein